MTETAEMQEAEPVAWRWAGSTGPWSVSSSYHAVKGAARIEPLYSQSDFDAMRAQRDELRGKLALNEGRIAEMQATNSRMAEGQMISEIISEAEIEAAERALHSSTLNGNTGLLTRHGVRMALLAARRVSSVPSFADGIEAAAKYAAKLRDDSRLEPMEFSEIAKGIRALAHNPQASNEGSTVHHGEKSVHAKMAILRESITSSEPPQISYADAPRSGAAEGNAAEAAAPSLKDVILDAARHVRARPAGLRGPYVIGDEELDGIIERLGPKSDASGAPKPDPAIAELVGRLEIAKSAIGRLRLDPGASAEDRKDRHAIDQAIAALTASNDRVAELERERDEALATMTRATEAMVECGNLLADEELKREAAEAEVSRLKAGAVTDWQLIESVPKDGRSIAVWLPATATEQPHAFAPVSICEDGTWWDDSTGGQIEPLAATYWAPIHAPSALSNQAEASE